jgi:uncharacterized membrane protein
VSLDAAVIRYDGEGTAVLRYGDARDRLGRPRPRQEQPEWTQDVGFVERRHNGRLRLRGTFAGHYLDVDESDAVSEQGLREGGAVGGLIGVLGGPPGIAVGILLGGVTGAQVGQHRETETEPEALADRVRTAVPPSSSAIVIVAPAAEVDELVAALGDGAMDITRTTLGDGQVAALETSLAGTPPSVPGI